LQFEIFNKLLEFDEKIFNKENPSFSYYRLQPYALSLFFSLFKRAIRITKIINYGIIQK